MKLAPGSKICDLGLKIFQPLPRRDELQSRRRAPDDWPVKRVQELDAGTVARFRGGRSSQLKQNAVSLRGDVFDDPSAPPRENDVARRERQWHFLHFSSGARGFGRAYGVSTAIVAPRWDWASS